MYSDLKHPAATWGCSSHVIWAALQLKFLRLTLPCGVLCIALRHEVFNKTLEIEIVPYNASLLHGIKPNAGKLSTSL